MVEQQLADITRDAAIQKEVSDTGLDVVVKWYKKNYQLDLTQLASWSVIDELRLVANTTKHAEGSSAKQLRAKNPKLFQYPPFRKEPLHHAILHATLSLPLGGDGLYVTGDEFRSYHKAVLELFEELRQYFEDHGDEYYPL